MIEIRESQCFEGAFLQSGTRNELVGQWGMAL